MKLNYSSNESIKKNGLKFNYIMVNSTAKVNKLVEYKPYTEIIDACDFLELKNYAIKKGDIYIAVKKIGKLFFKEIEEYCKNNIESMNSQNDKQNLIRNYAKAIMDITLSKGSEKTYKYICDWLDSCPFPYEIMTDNRYSQEQKYCSCSIKDFIIDATLIFFVDKLIRYRKAGIELSIKNTKQIYIFYSDFLENDFEEYEEMIKKRKRGIENLIIKIINYRKEKMNLYIYNKPYFIDTYYNPIKVYLEATNIMAVAYNEMELKLSTFEEEATGKKCKLPSCNNYFFPTKRQNRKEYCSPECRKEADRIKSKRYYDKHLKKCNPSNKY